MFDLDDYDLNQSSPTASLCRFESSRDRAGGEATVEGRIKAARCGRSIGWKMPAISDMLRTLQSSGTTFKFCESAVLPRLSAPCGGEMAGSDDLRIRPGPIRSTRAPKANPFSRRLSRPRKRQVVCHAVARGEGARSGAAGRQALPRHVSSTIAPAAPWSRRVWCGECGSA
jgi:hypothetical protein